MFEIPLRRSACPQSHLFAVWSHSSLLCRSLAGYICFSIKSPEMESPSSLQAAAPQRIRKVDIV